MPTGLAGHVVVAGDLASGKSTLARNLARVTGASLLAERPEHNPYLVRFYADPPTWAAASQRWFLGDEYRKHRWAQQHPPAVQDHSIYEVHEVFNRTLLQRAVLSPDEFDMLDRLYRRWCATLRQPCAVVRLRAPASVLLARVAARSRDYEADITVRYLDDLIARRDAYFRSWTASPLLTVDVQHDDIREMNTVGLVLDWLKQVRYCGRREWHNA